MLRITFSSGLACTWTRVVDRQALWLACGTESDALAPPPYSAGQWITFSWTWTPSTRTISILTPTKTSSIRVGASWGFPVSARIGPAPHTAIYSINNATAKDVIARVPGGPAKCGWLTPAPDVARSVTTLDATFWWPDCYCDVPVSTQIIHHCGSISPPFTQTSRSGSLARTSSMLQG